MGVTEKKMPGIVNAILLLLPFVILIALGFTLTREPGGQKTVPAPQASVGRSPIFCNGYDWKRIDAMNITPGEKIRIKSEMFRVEIETCYMTGTPMFSANVPMEAYLAAVDRFYSDKNNEDVPLFFAMKITDIAAKGAPEEAVKTYKLAVMSKLKMTKLIR